MNIKKGYKKYKGYTRSVYLARKSKSESKFPHNLKFFKILTAFQVIETYICKSIQFEIELQQCFKL